MSLLQRCYAVSAALQRIGMPDLAVHLPDGSAQRQKQPSRPLSVSCSWRSSRHFYSEPISTPSTA
eukprot:4673125-Amphidinium_carterae.5